MCGWGRRAVECGERTATSEGDKSTRRAVMSVMRSRSGLVRPNTQRTNRSIWCAPSASSLGCGRGQAGAGAMLVRWEGIGLSRRGRSRGFSTMRRARSMSWPGSPSLGTRYARDALVQCSRPGRLVQVPDPTRRHVVNARADGIAAADEEGRGELCCRAIAHWPVQRLLLSMLMYRPEPGGRGWWRWSAWRHLGVPSWLEPLDRQAIGDGDWWALGKGV